MCKKILLPLDLSSKSETAHRQVADLLQFSDGSVILFHVIETILGLPVESEQAFFDSLQQSGEAHLHQIGRTFDQHNVRWTMEIKYGKPVAEVVRFAKENDVDLIVLTAPNFDPENPTVGGASRSFKVSLLSHCPILLVK